MEANIVVVGASNIDICAKSSKTLKSYDSNIGEIEFAIGGVGRNIAEDLSLFGADVSLLTAIGDDSFGSVISDNAREQGVTLLSEPFKGEKTGVYVSINDEDGAFAVGINDMGITSRITPQVIKDNSNMLYFANYVVFEANLEKETIDEICSHDYTLIADGVSTFKCGKLADVLGKLWLLKANLGEARTLAGNEDYSAEQCMRALMDKGLEQGIITLGRDGAMGFCKDRKGVHTCYVSNLPNTRPSQNTSGCGDALLAGCLMGLIRGRSLKDAIVMGQAASFLNAQSFAPVNRDMSYTALKETVERFNAEAEIKEEVLR